MTAPAGGDCAAILRQIEDYLDGELDAVSCAAIERHCQGCASCTGVASGLRRTIGLCHEAGQTPLPESVRARARAQMKHLLVEARKPARRTGH